MIILVSEFLTLLAGTSLFFDATSNTLLFVYSTSAKSNTSTLEWIDVRSGKLVDSWKLPSKSAGIYPQPGGSFAPIVVLLPTSSAGHLVSLAFTQQPNE